MTLERRSENSIKIIRSPSFAECPVAFRGTVIGGAAIMSTEHMYTLVQAEIAEDPFIHVFKIFKEPWNEAGWRAMRLTD